MLHLLSRSHPQECLFLDLPLNIVLDLASTRHGLDIQVSVQTTTRRGDQPHWFCVRLPLTRGWLYLLFDQRQNLLGVP